VLLECKDVRTKDKVLGYRLMLVDGCWTCGDWDWKVGEDDDRFWISTEERGRGKAGTKGAVVASIGHCEGVESKQVDCVPYLLVSWTDVGNKSSLIRMVG